MNLVEFDKVLRQDYPLLCGIDEAGRGPLAGDVFAAAVIFDEDVVIEGINDSKKLSEKKREKLYDEIIAKAKYWCVARGSIEEIEKINILQADMLAMQRAVAGLGVLPDMAIVDGNYIPKLPCKTEFVVKGDALSQSIAAASILAKVSRDRYMLEVAKQYPEYKFEKHKGYGTKLHYEMIDEYGESPVHRHSFLKKYYEKKAAHEKGIIGEKCVAKYLEHHNLEILQRNWKVKGGEIDIIAKASDNTIIFVEVKTREQGSLTTPEEAITAKKKRCIIKAAEQYMQDKDGLNGRFDVACVITQGEKVIELKYYPNAFTK